jgi:hypothetical protein
VDQDTSQRQRERYLELRRSQTPAERLRTAAALSSAVRTLAEAGLRERHPGASPEEIRIRLTVRLYGRATAVRLFGDRVPADAV